MNRDNLLKLAVYLDTLPDDYPNFEMRTYFNQFNTDDSDVLEAKYARENGGVGTCGTSACALGHGPSAGILMPDSYVESDTSYSGKTFFNVDWCGYCRDFFIDQGSGGDGYDAWNWCFGALWSDYDNTPKGAARRIRYFLDKGVPDEFYGANVFWPHVYATA